MTTQATTAAESVAHFKILVDFIEDGNMPLAEKQGEHVQSMLEALPEDERVEAIGLASIIAIKRGTHGTTACMLAGIPTPEPPEPEDAITESVLDDLYPILDKAQGTEHDGIVKASLDLLAIMTPVQQERHRKRLIGCGLRAGFIDEQLKLRRNGGTPEVEPKAEQDDKIARIPSASRFLLYESADDEGNANCVKRMHGGEFAHCPELGWMHYNGTQWERNGAEAVLDTSVLETLKARRRSAVEAERTEIVKRAWGTAANVRNTKYLFRSMVDVRVTEFDSSPDHLNCKNGLLDLRTGELVTHEPAQRFTYCLPVAYDPEASSELWLKFLSETTTSRVIRRWLQKAHGYSLTGHTWEECLFHISGPPRSGKGTLTETVMHMMGREPLAKQTDFGTFTARRDQDAQNFALAPLKPCRLVVAGESKRNQHLNGEKVKGLTGGDAVYCAYKGRDLFNYVPQYKIWLVSNWSVNADPDDDALWARLRVLKFPNSRLGKEDKSLKARLRQLDNLAGVLAWAVAGARDWYAAGKAGLVVPHVIKHETESARDAIDYVSQWVSECIVKSDDPDAFIPNANLHGSYSSWCAGVGVTPKQLTALTQSLKRKRYDAGKPKKHKGKTVRGCVGVQFKAEPEPADPIL
jgi:putative DNA primase/helicase